MEIDPEDLVAEIIELATDFQTGTATDDERARLERLLEDSDAARMLYLRLADDVVTLSDVRARQEFRGAAPLVTLPHRGRLRSPRGRWAAFAASAAAIGVILGFWRPGSRGPGAEPNAASATASPQVAFARIVSISDIQWADGATPRREWQRLAAGQKLAFDNGSVELLYDNGVQLVLEGPVRCQLLSSGQLRVQSGKLVARVGPEAAGFQIVTPHATVIDLGTSFGMTIDPRRHSDVVVYEGIVDLSLAGSPTRRLNAGEAMRIDREGHVGRIASVAGGAFLPPPRLDNSDSAAGAILVGVTDNLKSSQTTKYYRIVGHGFREDCQAYVDRHHQWNGQDQRGVPPFLVGGDYVMTFNDDKVQHDLRIAVEVAQPARLYLLVDDRARPPNWLLESFQDTGWDVGLDEGYDDVPDVQTAAGAGRSLESTFSIWRRDVPTPTTVLLGPLQMEETSTPPRELLQAMYGIVATPLTAAAPKPID